MRLAPLSSGVFPEGQSLRLKCAPFCGFTATGATMHTAWVGVCAWRLTAKARMVCADSSGATTQLAEHRPRAWAAARAHTIRAGPLCRDLLVPQCFICSETWEGVLMHLCAHQPGQEPAGHEGKSTWPLTGLKPCFCYPAPRDRVTGACMVRLGLVCERIKELGTGSHLQGVPFAQRGL